MSEGIAIALIGFAGAILGAVITGIVKVVVDGKSGQRNSIAGCSLGLLLLLGAIGGLVLSVILGILLIQPWTNGPPTAPAPESTPPTSSPSPETFDGAGCICSPRDCNGVPVKAGANVPASAILEPYSGNRGTLYMYLRAGEAEVDGMLWTYVDRSGAPASRNCVESQLLFFQYDNLRTIK